MTRSNTLTILLLLFSSLAFSQTSIITIHVVDSLTNHPLEGVRAFDQTNNKTYLSNAKGTIVIPAESINKKNILEFTLNEYEVFRKPIEPNAADEFTIKLQRLNLNIPEVEILPELPDFLYFGKPGEDVADYILTPEYTIVCLYEPKSRSYQLVLLDSTGEISDEESIKPTFERFFTNGLGYKYLVCTDAIYEIRIKRGFFEITDIKPKLFNSKAVFYREKHNQFYYLNKQSRSKQSLVYFIEDSEKKIIYESQPFCVVKDDRKEANAMKDYVIYDSIRKLEMSQIIPDYDMNTDILEGHEGNVSFQKKNEYIQRYIEHPIYAPLFLTADGLSVFDMVHYHINNYTFSGELKSEKDIKTDHTEGILSQVLKTEKDQFFLLYQNKKKSTDLYRLNPEDNSLVLVKTLRYKGIENFWVRGEFIYYIRKGTSVKENDFVFREKL